MARSGGGRNTAMVVVLLLGAAVVVLLRTAEAAAGNDNNNGTSRPTAYEMLERYGFPRGILPEGVQGYELRGDDDGGASFEVYFPRACEFLLSSSSGGWLVRYDARVSGAAAAGSLTALRGISVRVAFFLWLPVGEVHRATGADRLSFYVGPVATSFPLADFADSPRCRGYDHGDGDGAAASAR